MHIGLYKDALNAYIFTLNSKTKESKMFKATYLFQIACCYARLEEKDSAIEYLKTSLLLDYRQPFIYDLDLKNLHTHQYWDTLVYNNKNTFYEKNKMYSSVYYAYQLNVMKSSDQCIRSVINEHRYKETKSELWKIQNSLDSANILSLINIINDIGWPNYINVGTSAAYAAFLILQHADLAIQKKYIPLVEKEAKLHNISPAHLAYLEDRIAIREGGPQIYGTQINMQGKEIEPYPVINPTELNNRRKSIGLEPIEEYLKGFKH